jgi:hypothetical protein
VHSAKKTMSFRPELAELQRNLYFSLKRWLSDNMWWRVYTYLEVFGRIYKYICNNLKLWSWASSRHWKVWMFWIVDYLFVFVYIYCHFKMILQIRSAYCKKKHVIWTRIGGATEKSLFQPKQMTKQWRTEETMTHILFPITLMGNECASFQGTREPRDIIAAGHISNSKRKCNSVRSTPNYIK